MSSIHIIVCKFCGSYRTECIAETRGKMRFRCACCGDDFYLDDVAAYVKQHPPDIRRCSECDKIGVELMEQNYRRTHQDDGEVADLYKCPFCGQKVILIVQPSPDVLYG